MTRVSVNPEPIPEELKDRDQWLLWDASNDTPRRPHWKGDFHISWSDPDDWHSFPEALAAAESNASWGIGYVMAQDNDDCPTGIYGCLDLDGCLTGPESPKDWLPSLQRFIDDGAYLERSPSGDGLHIPLVGQDAPEWWTDSHFSDDEHEGVEWLTNKFCTFTGDLVGDQHDGVADTDPTEFLFEAYQVLNGEAPRVEPSDDARGHDDGMDLSETHVKEALACIPSDCAYPQWRDIGFAVHDWDSTTTGKSLFESWSRGSGWDDQSQRYVDAIWQNAEQGDGVTVGTLIHHATSNGWEPPRTGGSSGGEIPPSSTDSAEDASDDGGEIDEPREPDDAGDSAPANNEFSNWKHIRQMFRDSENAEERAVPRFESAMKLHQEFSFANLQENEQLYVYDGQKGIYEDKGEQLIRQQLTEGLEEQYRGHAMSEITDHVRGRNTLPQSEMGGPDGYIAARNCVIDLHESERREHSPDHRFLSRLGCDFDPDAEAPQWEQFLDEVIPKASDRKKLQEFAGYCLHHWSLPYHKALFLVGPTASGKSTFLDTLNALLGENTVASLTPQQLTSERFGPAELYGKWANIRNDIPKSTVENTGMFKELVAGDPMKAERKNKDPFFFNPSAKHLFSANQLPEMEVDDEAFFRRILLVPFPETIPEGDRDKHLDDKLQDELPGVLNWAIEGLQRLLGNGGFTADRSPARTRETWSKWGDSVSRFYDAAVTSGDDDVSKAKLFAAYIEYCRQESIPSDTQHAMTRQLKQEGLEDGRAYVDGERKRVFHNIALTGRGQELLEAAQSDSGGSSENDQRRRSGLGEFD